MGLWRRFLDSLSAGGLERLLPGGAGCLLLWSACCTLASAAEQDVHALRSAYLYYFSNLIEWPEARETPDRLHLCALTRQRDDRFQLSTIDGKRVNDQVLTIVFPERDKLTAQSLGRCQILYVGADQTDFLDQIPELPETVVLVSEGRPRHKGVIHLYIRNNKLRFEIDSEALTDKAFKISSKLLRLAR